MNTLHIDIMVALKAAGGFGLPVDALLIDLRRGRHRALTLPQAEQALRDLADRRHAAPETDDFGTRWRITAHGVSTLEEKGLA